MNYTLVNIFSNFISRIWAVLIGILLIPIYIEYIGIESYGMVGFYTTLVGSLAILDLGLSTTLSRELSRSKVINISSESVINLVFSLELLFWIIGLIISVLIILFAPFLSQSWLKVGDIAPKIVQNSIILMGGIIFLQWPQSIYIGGLIGLQKNLILNLVNILLGTLKGFGALLVLNNFSPTLLNFFTWQIIVTLMSTLILRHILWKNLPRGINNPRFSKAEIRKVGKFAAGMTGIGLATFCLSQVDKILLSNLLSLKNFGYYSLSWTISNGVSLLVGAMGATLSAKITSVVAKKNEIEIKNHFHNYNTLMVSIVIPVGLILIIFSREVVMIWTNNITTTNEIWLSVSILSGGSLLNAFIHLPYYLLLAYGDTKFTIYQNIIASVILVPLLFYWTGLWGLTGASMVWFLVNLGYFIFSLPLIHNYLIVLKGEFETTLLSDVGKPFLISIIIISFGYCIYPSQINRWYSLLFLSILTFFTYAGIVFFTPQFKFIMIKFFERIRNNERM